MHAAKVCTISFYLSFFLLPFAQRVQSLELKNVFLHANFFYCFPKVLRLKNSCVLPHLAPNFLSIEPIECQCHTNVTAFATRLILIGKNAQLHECHDWSDSCVLCNKENPQNVIETNLFHFPRSRFTFAFASSFHAIIAHSSSTESGYFHITSMPRPSSDA